MARHDLKLDTRRVYGLPFPFPNGKAWAAVKDGRVVHMAYMEPPPGVKFHIYRQRARGEMARHGIVLTGEVRNGQFHVLFETTDIRHTGVCNTAREVC